MTGIILPIRSASDSIYEDVVAKHIADYMRARDAFNDAGGQAFIKDRREVRAAYCDATVSSDAIEKWIANLPSPAVQNEFSNRFKEWNGKIAKGIGGISKSESPSISEERFFEILEAYYKKHEDFLKGPFFADFNSAKAILRSDLLPELKNASVDTVAKRYNIQDQELIDRMKFEWSWKA